MSEQPLEELSDIFGTDETHGKILDDIRKERERN